MGGGGDNQAKINTVFLGLGSNVGDRERYIDRALELLGSHPEIAIEAISSLYETEPVGFPNQRDFLNAVVKIETALTPHQLLSVTKGIERSLHRRRSFRNAPRTIDVDILFFDGLVMDEPHLHLPHPELVKRAFVLTPLAEVAPDLQHPCGKTAKELLIELSESGKAERVRVFRQVEKKSSS